MTVLNERLEALHFQARLISWMVFPDKTDEPLFELTLPNLLVPEAPKAVQLKFDLEDELLREFEHYDRPKPLMDGSDSLSEGSRDLIDELEMNLGTDRLHELDDLEAALDADLQSHMAKKDSAIVFTAADIAGLRQAIGESHPEFSPREIEAEMRSNLGLNEEDVRRIEAASAPRPVDSDFDFDVDAEIESLFSPQAR